MKQFLLIDDHFVVRSGIKGLLSELYKPCEVYEANDSEGAIVLLKERPYDLIMMDVHVPKSDMLGLMEYVQVRYPESKVLIFSMSPETVYAKKFLKAGAKGFLSKDSSAAETVKAINQVMNNRRYVSETLAQILAEDSIHDNPSNPFDKLSPREFQIVFMLLKGQPLHEIAKSLHIQPSTAGSHKAKLFKKMGVSNLMELKDMAVIYMPK